MADDNSFTASKSTGRSQSGLFEFKPAKDFGMGGTYNGLTTYKKALKDAVDNTAARLSQCGPSGPQLPTYLKWTIDNINGSNSFNSDGKAMKAFFQKLGTTPTTPDPNYQHYKKILVYWAENLGPINMMENHSDIFPTNSTVFIPKETSTGLWDFKVNGSEISVKAPKGKTNILKPQFIVGQKELAKVMKGSRPSKPVKKLYKIFQQLAERPGVGGPVYVAYGDKGDNGILSNDLKNVKNKKNQDVSLNIMKTPTPPPICTDKKVQEARWNETEKAIQAWGTSPQQAPTVKILAHNFLKYSELTLLKMNIDTGTGIPKFTWGSNLTSAEFLGKGKRGERMGIEMKFDDKFYTDGF